MKKFVFLLTTLISLAASAQKYNFQSLVGSWRNKEGAGLEVVDSSRIYVVYGDQKKQLVNYAVDFSSNPARFNLVLKDAAGIINIKSVLLFISDELIQWQVLDSETRPVRYNSSQSARKDLVILRKVEESTN
jgi:hypothetical protein